MARTSRWCLDLNIWYASLLADFKDSQGSACQTLVDIVRRGYYQDRSVDLIISWGMLDRLRQVLWRLGIENNLATGYVDVIRAYCDLNPSLTPESTGVIPERHYHYFSPYSTLEIVHPYLIVEWLRSGIFFNQI